MIIFGLVVLYIAVTYVTFAVLSKLEASKGKLSLVMFFSITWPLHIPIIAVLTSFFYFREKINGEKL